MKHWLVFVRCKTGGPEPDTTFTQVRRVLVVDSNAQEAALQAGLYARHTAKGRVLSIEPIAMQGAEMPFELPQTDA